MNDALIWAISLSAAYLIGAIPNGLLASRLWRGIDIRDYGSGGSGATNVLRTLGKPAAALVLALDFAKGVIAVWLPRLLTDDAVSSHLLFALCGSTAVAGHTWPIYVGFKGGKGIATGWGALLVLSPIATLATLLGTVILITRYVSLASILGAISGVAALIILSLIGVQPIEYTAFGAPAIAFILFRHIDNIRRLLRGRERRLETKPRPERSSYRD